MKGILVILFSVFLVETQHEDADLLTAINKSNFVGFVFLEQYSKSGNSNYKVEEVFKGDIFHFTAGQSELIIIDERKYLVIGTVEHGVLSNLNFPAEIVENLSNETINVIKNLPCYDADMERKYEIVYAKGCLNQFAVVIIKHTEVYVRLKNAVF